MVMAKRTEGLIFGVIVFRESFRAKCAGLQAFGACISGYGR
jgi:hypothetical protein